MLTPRQILRHARAERFGTLLDAVITNGRSCPLALRLHVERDSDWTLTALALGAHRALELTFPISFEAAEMLDRLVDALRARGIGGAVPARVGGEARPVSPVALAACAVALGAAVREAEGLPGSEGHEALMVRVRAALDDAGAALARWQWTGSTATDPTLWSEPGASDDGLDPEERAYANDPMDLGAVLWMVRDGAAAIPHADVPALASLAEAMGLLHDRVLGPVVRASI